jgi:acyl-CoA thioester hydrolase
VTHQYDIKVRWADLDPYRHLNHAMFLTYCEAARIDLLGGIGFSMERLTELGKQVVVVGVSAKFLKPALENTTVTIRTRHIGATRATMTWRQEMFHGDIQLFSADITFAFTDLVGRPTRRPPGFLEAVS